MEIGPYVRWQRVEPGRGGSRGKGRLERAGEGGIVDDLAKEAGRCRGLEDGEDWSGGKSAGELVRDGTETEEDCGVGGEGGYSGEGSSGSLVRSETHVLGSETDKSNSSETLPCLFSTASGVAIAPIANAKRRAADERCMM